MDKNHFLRQLEEILDLSAGTLSGGESLEGLEHWDSLAVLGVVAFADEAGIALQPQQFRGLKTVDEVFALVQAGK